MTFFSLWIDVTNRSFCSKRTYRCKKERKRAEVTESSQTHSVTCVISYVPFHARILLIQYTENAYREVEKNRVIALSSFLNCDHPGMTF